MKTGDAGFDLCATKECVLKPFERQLVPTGIHIAIPAGYGGFVLPRSGISLKHGITLINAPGLIDSNYRGEILIPLANMDAQNSFTIEVGMRIAQLVILKVEDASFMLTDALDPSNRGSLGFGSSGLV